MYHWSYGLWGSKEAAFLASMMGGRWGSEGLGMDGGELTLTVCQHPFHQDVALFTL